MKKIKNNMFLSAIVIAALTILNCNELPARVVMPNALAEEIEFSGYEPSLAGFFAAAEDGDVKVLSLFAEANISANVKDDTGKTPIFKAAESGKDKAVRFLLLCGADINVRDNNMKSPLMAAIEAKSYRTAQILIDMNASINVSDEDGLTPLHYAVLSNKADITQYILTKHCDIDATDNEENTPLFYAVNTGSDINILKNLINAGADRHYKNEYGKTVLHQAVINGNFNAVKILVDSGMNLNIEDNNGRLPITYAIKGSPIYRYLLEAGAKVPY